MPTNTKVHRMAKAMERSGVPEGEAIATAQKRTHQSYATGKMLTEKKSKKKSSGNHHKHRHAKHAKFMKEMGY